MSKKIIGPIIAILAIAGALLVFGSGSTDQPNLTDGSLEAMINQPAPDFSLNDQQGKLFKLSEMRGKNVVLFFNEGIMCYPACWNQVAALGSLKNSKTVTASIVVDKPGVWDSAFKKMPELNSGPILFDSDKKVSREWQMLSLPSSMHKGVLPGHTYVIVDQKGIIRYTQDDPKMGVRNNELTKQLENI